MPRGNVPALDVTPEVEILRRGQQRVGLLRQRVALAGLLADREQADRWRPHVQDRRGEGRAHVRELEEVLRAGIGVRPAVDQHDGAARGRNRLHDRRAQDALDPAHVHQRRGHHGPRRARRDGSDRATLPDRAAALDERGVGLRAHGERGLLVPADHLRRVHDVDARRQLAAELLEQRLLRSAEQDAYAPGRGRLNCTGDGLARRVVSPHRVERDGEGPSHVASGSISRPLYVLHVGHM